MKYLSKLLAVILLGLGVANNAFADKMALLFDGKQYVEKAPHIPEGISELALSYLDAINNNKNYDNQITNQFKMNTNLVPFVDLFDEYQKVFKNNDDYLRFILIGDYNSKILKAYLDYEQNFLNNFKQNLKLFKERATKEDKQRILSGLEDFEKKLSKQLISNKDFFEYLEKTYIKK